jgi:DNA-binding NarL/FixJ family response regulator
LFKGLEAVLTGDRYLDESISSMSIMRLTSAETLRRKSILPKTDLTAREREVTRLLAEGIPRKEIANRLYISPKTVENHISRTMKKLSLRNSIELTLWAVKLGLINPDEWRGGPLRRDARNASKALYQESVG